VNDWVCGNCKSINRASANSCYSCGGAREIVAAPELRAIGGVSSPAPTLAAAEGGVGVAALGSPLDPGTMVGGPAASVADATPNRPASTSDILGGLLAGLVAAVLATGIWYGVVAVSQYQVGLVAIAVGFIVGYGVVLGANRRGSVVLVAISVVLTLLALVISEYLIVAHFVGQELAAQGMTIELLQPPDFIVSVVKDSVQADPLTLVFWAIAVFQAFAIPSRSLGRGAA
jgi:hypothetical protein